MRQITRNANVTAVNDGRAETRDAHADQRRCLGGDDVGDATKAARKRDMQIVVGVEDRGDADDAAVVGNAEVLGAKAFGQHALAGVIVGPVLDLAGDQMIPDLRRDFRD